MQIEQLAVAARWVFGLGMRQLMAAWVLGSKIGLSSVGVGSGVMAWAVTSQRDGSLTFSVSLSSLPFFSFLFFFFSFVSGFSVWFRSLLLYWVFFFFFFFFSFLHIYIYLYIYIKVFMGSWKLPGWPTAMGMIEVGGPELKPKGGPS